MLGGLEFAAFPARKRKTEQSGRLEPAFHRKPANLEARASHLQSDTKNGLFGLDRFKRFFAPKTEPDGAVTSVVTSSAGSGDEAVTSGDMLGGLEFAAFPARKRKTEQSGRLEPAFHRKPANLEARASHLQSDTKNGSTVLHQKTEPDGAASVVTSSAG